MDINWQEKVRDGSRIRSDEFGSTAGSGGDNQRS
jgi:hypothetical protein